MEDTYLQAFALTVFDMAGNNLTELRSLPTIESLAALRATNYTRDAIRPTFRSCELNMAAGQLVLSYSETMDADMLNPTQVRYNNTSGPSAALFAALLAMCTANCRNTLMNIFLRRRLQRVEVESILLSDGGIALCRFFSFLLLRTG